MKARCEARLSYFRVNSCVASQLHALAAWNLQAKPPLVNRLPLATRPKPGFGVTPTVL
jgi:hypothetical protein